MGPLFRRTVWFFFMVLLLAPTYVVVLGQKNIGARRLRQSGSEQLDVSKDLIAASPSSARPFRKCYDTDTATAEEVQLLYDQANCISSIAYLLFAAAGPLSGLRNAYGELQKYLIPNVLHAYALQANPCNSGSVENLYNLARSLCSTQALQACHSELFKAVSVTFTRVAKLHDLDTLSVSDLENVVQTLLDSGDVDAASIEGCIGNASDFVALVSQIITALQHLNDDLEVLQTIAARRNPAFFEPVRDLPKDVQSPLSDTAPSSQRQQSSLAATTAARAASKPPAPPVVNPYMMPPSDFTVQQPTTMPQLLFPLVFHVLTYRDGNGIGPVGYNNSLHQAERTVKLVNYISKPANVQYFIKEVRSDPTKYPYLLLKNRKTWLDIAKFSCKKQDYCFLQTGFVDSYAVDFPRSINVWIASDATALRGTAGYAMLPQSDVEARGGLVFVSWDTFALTNSESAYNFGPFALAHELFHHLGLDHTFNKPPKAPACTDGDMVDDTPAVADYFLNTAAYTTGIYYCLDLFWKRFSGSWEVIYNRWTTTLGIPDLDKNAWADSCPDKPGFDELGNYMTYNAPVCMAVLGHLTVGQAQRIQYITAEFNPVQYAWGQYYAVTGSGVLSLPSLPPQPGGDPCKETIKYGCACKSSWQYKGKTYSFCDNTPVSPNHLACEVVDPASCFECNITQSGFNPAAQCIVGCAGKPDDCQRPTWPPFRSPPPPPPFPKSPPPAPPPPPPSNVPADCKVSVSGCACRSSWVAFNNIGHYCDVFVINATVSTVACVVTTDCPSFWVAPVQICKDSLTAAYCAGTSSPPYGRPPKTPKAPSRKKQPPPPPLRNKLPPPPSPKKKHG